MINFLSIILILSAIVLIRMKNNPAAILCVVLMFLLAVARPFLVPSPDDLAARFDEMTKTVMTDVLAEKIVQQYPGKNIAIIGLPDVEAFEVAFEQSLITQRLLTKALEELGVTVKQVPMPFKGGAKTRSQPEWDPADGPAPVDYFPETVSEIAVERSLSQFGAAKLNRMLGDLHDEVDVVVCALPLKLTLAGGRLLPRGDGPALILVHADVSDLDDALDNTVLEMALNNRSGASWDIDESLPENTQEAFDARYVIASREAPEPTP